MAAGNCDAAKVDSCTKTARIGTLWDERVVLLEACSDVVDTISPVKVSIEESLKVVPAQVAEVVWHTI